MPTGELKEPLDSNGRPLKGRALEYHLRKQAEVQAAAQAREDIEALARVVCRMAARGLMMPAPDALAVLGAQGGPRGPRGRAAVPAGGRLPPGAPGAAVGRGGPAAPAVEHRGGPVLE